MKLNVLIDDRVIMKKGNFCVADSCGAGHCEPNDETEVAGVETVSRSSSENADEIVSVRLIVRSDIRFWKAEPEPEELVKSDEEPDEIDGSAFLRILGGGLVGSA